MLVAVSSLPPGGSLDCSRFSSSTSGLGQNRARRIKVKLITRVGPIAEGGKTIAEIALLEACTVGDVEAAVQRMLDLLGVASFDAGIWFGATDPIHFSTFDPNWQQVVFAAIGDVVC
ncbi:hypothetical protein NXC24_PA00235 (plasmid) [Rhizobium sp. NXC24]|nr:hypothetical protein NXC24_PA00235 [Rhizobium sp. NXC24]